MVTSAPAARAAAANGALLNVDGRLGDGVEREAPRVDRVLRAVDPVAGRQVHAGVAVVRCQALRADALGVETVGRAEDLRVAVRAGAVGQPGEPDAELRLGGRHVRHRGGEAGGRPEVAGQHRRIAQRSLAAHRDPGDRVPAPAGTDPIAALDLAAQDLQVIARPCRAATGAAVPPIGRTSRTFPPSGMTRIAREVRQELPDAGNPAVRAAVRAVEEPEDGVALLRLRVVAVGQHDVDLRRRALLLQQGARLRRVDQRARQRERLQLGCRRSGRRSRHRECQAQGEDGPPAAGTGTLHAGEPTAPAWLLLHHRDVVDLRPGVTVRPQAGERRAWCSTRCSPWPSPSCSCRGG